MVLQIAAEYTILPDRTRVWRWRKSGIVWLPLFPLNMAAGKMLCQETRDMAKPTDARQRVPWGWATRTFSWQTSKILVITKQLLYDLRRYLDSS